jgi:hypothetical protein
VTSTGYGIHKNISEKIETVCGRFLILIANHVANQEKKHAAPGTWSRANHTVSRARRVALASVPPRLESGRGAVP